MSKWYEPPENDIISIMSKKTKKNRIIVILLTRYGVICSRKLHHSAVVRNRARRLITETFRLCKETILPCSILIIPRRAIFGAKQQEVQEHLIRTLKKAGLIREKHIATTPSANS